MRTVGRTGIVMAGCLALALLPAGCSDDSDDQPLPAKRGTGEPNPPKPGQHPPETFTVNLGDGQSMTFVFVSVDRFMMGSPETDVDRLKDEGPRRQVTISRAFCISTTEVTQAQWQQIMRTEPWKHGKWAKYAMDGDDHAASNIRYKDAEAFCKALREGTGDISPVPATMAVRLPTEAEWEYACRAGTTTRFSYGDAPADLGDYAWYDANAAGQDEQYAHPVKQKTPNAWGLYDMHGNVREWCSDRYASSYDPADTTDPQGPTRGGRHVARGGSWLSKASACRSAHRGADAEAGSNLATFGFRVAFTYTPAK